MLYGVAYRDKNGKGFSESEPWISTDFSEKQDAVAFVSQLKSDGYPYAQLFSYVALPVPSITYDWVAKHLA